MKSISRLALVLAAATMITACDNSTMKSEPLTSEQLTGKLWVLETINGAAPTVDERPNLNFDATDAKTGKLAGSNACNRYFGSYTLEDSMLTVGTVGTSMMACPPEAMEQEKQYMAAFNTVKNIRMDGEKLVLTSEDGKTNLTFAVQAEKQ